MNFETEIFCEFDRVIRIMGYTVDMLLSGEVRAAIYKDAENICFQNKNGTLSYQQRYSDAAGELNKMFSLVQEYVTGFSQASAIKCGKGYICRRLCEYEHIYLGVNKTKTDRYEFLTWDAMALEAKVPAAIHMFTDFSLAKADFALRAGFVTVDSVNPGLFARIESCTAAIKKTS
jgi:hypothetical protein